MGAHKKNHLDSPSDQGTNLGTLLLASLVDQRQMLKDVVRHGDGNRASFEGVPYLTSDPVILLLPPVGLRPLLASLMHSSNHISASVHVPHCLQHLPKRPQDILAEYHKHESCALFFDVVQHARESMLDVVG